MTIPTEIVDFMFEVLYSDGTPGKIKQTAFELISHHDLKMGDQPQAIETVTINLSGQAFDIPKEKALEIDAHVKGGLKINAIKVLREWASKNNAPWGLKECKDCIDAWSPGVIKP